MLFLSLPSWIWMMPPVMAQIVATQIFRTFEHFLLGFFGLHLFLLESLFVDEDELFKDDRAVHQTLLHSRYAHFHRLDTAVSHLESSASGEPVSDVQECESREESVKNGGTSGAVHVSSGSSTGPEADEIHCAALVCHRYPGRSHSTGRPSFMDMDDASSDGTNGSDSDFQWT